MALTKVTGAGVGNVDSLGIGEDTPSETLQITSTDGQSDIRLHRQDTTIANDDNYGTISWTGADSDSNADGVRGFISGKAQGTGGGFKMEFGTAGGGVAIGSDPRMTIDADGNVGIGVASGDVTSDGTAARTYVGIIGTANRGRLNIGSTAHNGADGGVVSFVNGANELGNIYMDSNSGSQTSGKMYITSTDVVKLSSSITSGYALTIEATGNSGTPETLFLDTPNYTKDSTGGHFLKCDDSTATRMVIDMNGSLRNHDNSYGSLSDERIKQDISDASSQWDDIKAVKVRKYKKKDDVAQYKDKAWEQIGVVAQELEASGMDKLVDIDNESEEKWKSVKYSVLYMKAIKALQEAMTRIETLETKVKALEDG